VYSCLAGHFRGVGAPRLEKGAAVRPFPLSDEENRKTPDEPLGFSVGPLERIADGPIRVSVRLAVAGQGTVRRLSGARPELFPRIPRNERERLVSFYATQEEERHLVPKSNCTTHLVFSVVDQFSGMGRTGWPEPYHQSDFENDPCRRDASVCRDNREHYQTESCVVRE